MKSILCFLTLLLAVLAPMRANPIDSLEQRLHLNQQVQEKIYIHTDNRSYFLGDTLWYKAYVLRADDLKPTDMSKILYVELLTPDGYLVERQRVVIDHETQSFGQFAFPDSLYSGYYELRAYTRWQLNFNVTEREHDEWENGFFINSQYAKDYFRDFGSIYSRVFPIYDKPSQAGDFRERWITGRPKRRLTDDRKPLSVSFYPEGGAIVKGLDNRVAFEIYDPDGRPLSTEVRLDNGLVSCSNKDGRGVLVVHPEDDTQMRAFLSCQGKQYEFPLPTVQDRGAIVAYEADREEVFVKVQGVQIGALSVTCRGRLVAFQRRTDKPIRTSQWPTGVNEVTVYDEQGHPISVRQVFVTANNPTRRLKPSYQYKKGKYKNPTFLTDSFQSVVLQSRLGKSGLKSVSISVNNKEGDEPSFDDGNIMTDLLLAGDLRGFVAHPAYYFQSNDLEHRKQLDLLMMIQGWKKYSAPVTVRYQPEKTLSVEGYVTANEKIYMQDKLDNYIFENCGYDLLNPCFYGSRAWQFDQIRLPKSDNLIASCPYHNDSVLPSGQANRLLLEAELNRADNQGYVSMEADADGHFLFHIPPYYGKATLSLTAYKRCDSINCCLSSHSDKYKYNPGVEPYYFIRLHRFYPMQVRPYSWLETHSPQDMEYWEEELLSVDSLSERGNDRWLENVTVAAKRRRSLRKFDKTKPAWNCDFGRLYNELIDRGLHRQSFNPIAFWPEASHLLFAPMEHANDWARITATIDNHYFIKPVFPDIHPSKLPDALGEPMTPVVLQRLLSPQNIGQIRVYTDFDLRSRTGKEENRKKADVWFDISSLKDGEHRPVRRDRSLELDGIAYPEQFYHRDYSGQTPRDSSDYRRTLYWNPNARVDADGNLNVKFYNGARPAYLRVSMCGISEDGKIYYTEE